MRRPLMTAAALFWAGAAGAEPPSVATDIPVTQSLVAQVMGDLGMPGALVPAGADAHAYQLRPSEARAIAGADLFFWVGPELTPWLDRVRQAAGVRSVALLGAEGTVLRDYGEGEEHGHDHSGHDPHAWLDPENARIWLARIRDELATADPDNRAAYDANLARALAGIDALDAGIRAKLGAVPQTPVVVAHDALGYFAARYGVPIAASLAAGDAAEPGAEHLSEVAALLSSSAARCVFPEAGDTNSLAARLAADSGAKLGEPLDPEGRTAPPGPGLYATVMTGLAEAIAACQAD